ncbi:DNA polymerase [Trema orientale]|uniref:DNA polymerase n=1 Tax=Trema orientale TaxID=63057 RepID=A0A2P5EXX8_TREOI|nr:DNA polymerase [Trema orientale]
MANRETYNYHEIDIEDDSVQALVTNSPSMVESWISEIERIHHRRLNRLVVGLDVEWRPSFSRARNPLATLQLCVGRRCLIFQLLHAPYVPDALREFLSDGAYTFVGAGIGKDAEKLAEEQDLEVANWVDLGVLAADVYGDRSMRGAGLKGLAREYLEMEMEKPRHVALSDWDSRWLSDEQVRYACTDAFVSFEVGRVLKAWKYG